MSVIRNSLFGLIAALIPFAVYHGVMAGLGLAGHIAFQAQLPTPDRAFSIFLLRCAIDAALLVLGHLALRAFRKPSRVAYTFMGGMAGAIGYVVTLWGGIWIASPFAGTYLTGAIMPVFVGMLAGFLYAQLAGREATTRPRPWRAAPTPASPGQPAAPAAYDGPVQVRTSIAAIVLAATLPAVFAAIVAIPLAQLAFGNFLPHVQQDDEPFNRIMQLALPAQAFMTTLVATIIPATIVACATHAIARGLGRLRGRDYAMIGAAVSCLAALLLVMLVNPAMLFPAAAIVGALMGAVYRRFAGLEPLSLPEPVLVSDRVSLVGADDPARRQHAVINNG